MPTGSARLALAVLLSPAGRRGRPCAGRRASRPPCPAPSRTRRARSCPARPSPSSASPSAPQSAPVVTNGSGDFVFPNIAADTYTIQVEMPSFKTLLRSGLIVSPGSTIALGALTIEIGGTSEVVTVKGETPLVQTATGEKSISIDPGDGRRAAAQQPQLRRAARARARRQRRSQLARQPADDRQRQHQPAGHAASAAAATATTWSTA